MHRWLGFVVLLAGVAAAAPQQKWGFIDKSGEFAIAPKYDGCRGFSEGLAAVKVGARWGFIDKTGKVIVHPRFDKVHEFTEGLAGVQLGGKWGFIDKTGKVAIPLQITGYPFPFSHGRALVMVVVRERMVRGMKLVDHMHGYIDKTGKTIIPYRFPAAFSFSEGLAGVSEDNEKWGYIDASGKWVIEPRFRSAYPFSDGLAAVGVNLHKCGYIDRTGKMVMEPRFERPSSFVDGRALVRLSYTSDAFVIDKTGKTVVSNPNGLNLLDVSGDIVRVKIGGKHGILDGEGKLMDVRHWWIYPAANGLARVSSAYEGPFGFIDKTGKSVIPLRFPAALDFSEELAPAAKP